MEGSESDAIDDGVVVDELDDLRDRLSTIAGRLSRLCTFPEQGRDVSPDDLREVRVLVGEATDRLDALQTKLAGDVEDRPRCEPGRVLIVDDEENYCRALRRKLNDAGFDAFYETDPGRAPASVLHRRPSIAFIDLCMPEVDGWALAGALHNLNPELTIVLVTGYFTRDRVTETGSVGNYVVDKDLGFEVLVEIATGRRPRRRVLTRKSHLA